MRNKVFNMAWGLSLLLIGIILFGNTLNLWFIDVFVSGWWILFVIVPSLIGLCINERKLLNLTVLFVGVLVFSLYRNVWSFDVIGEVVLSLFVLITGGTLFGLTFNKSNKKLNKNSKENSLNFNGFFSSFNEKISKINLTDIKINMYFSKINLDMNSSLIKKDVRIKVVNVFGFIRIIGCNNVNVEISGSNICSLINNDVRIRNNDFPTIYIDVVSLLGIIKVKNR